MKKDKVVNKWEQGKTVKKKSQTVVGKVEYLNPETGELEPFTLIEKNLTKDFNFHKIWLQDVLNILDSFGNKKILVITYLLKQMRNEDNTFSGSYREFAEGCKVSLPTVSLVINELLDSNVIKRIRLGTYQFNPSLLVKGTSAKRTNLLIRYNYPEDDAKQIENAKNTDVKPQSMKQHNIFGGIDLIDFQEIKKNGEEEKE